MRTRPIGRIACSALLLVVGVLAFSYAAWAQDTKVDGSAPVNNVPVVTALTNNKTLIGQSPITAAIGATGPVSMAGSLAVTGAIAGGANITATGNVSGANVSATAGNVSASLDVIAGGNVKANPTTGTVSGFGGVFVGDGGGVIGRDTHPDGPHAGVIGIADSSQLGSGMQGSATACDQLITDTSPCDFSQVSGQTFGVQGLARSPFGTGAQGVVTAATGPTRGVFGRADSLNGTGVFGFARSTSTDPSAGTIGVRGLSRFNSGIGVRGDSEGTTGFPIGVLGTVTSSGGVAALFEQHSGVSSSNIIQARAVDPTNPSVFTNVFRVDNAGNVFALGTFTPNSSDFAESVDVAGERAGYQPGDVLVIDLTSNRRVALAHEPYSTLVAGIYSTKPGVLGSPNTEAGQVVASVVPLAIVGIVPCKVTAENGPIQRGDLLVVSSKPGRAMRGTDHSRMLGAVVAKALEPLPSGEGMIQVLVTLQ